MSHTAHLRLSLFASASLALCLSHSGAYAAGPNVDAGALLRQAEQQIKPDKSAKKRAPRKATPTAPVQATDATVEVKAFAFKGNTLLKSEALQTALVSFTNRALTLAQLKEAADAITNTYREAGWTVRAYVPKQEISNGVVTLQIVEAVFGHASVQTTSVERIEASRLVGMAEVLLSKGKPIHANDIDRALLLLDDLPGVSVSGNLTEGQREGETDLAIFAADDALITGNAIADNQGSRATGTDRLSVNLNVNSPARFGDALNLNALKTQGSEYQRLGYTVPVGYSGWRAGVHASNLNYHVITPEFAALNPHGTATTHGWDVSYPLVRGQLQNVNFALSYDDKKFDNTSNGTTTSYGIKVYNASLSANQTDQWNGGGITNANLSLTSGDKSTEDRYSKIGLNVSRLQTLSETLSAYAAFNAQATNRNLDSSEKLYLGGATGVRAYPASEAGGSDGHTLTLELRQRLAYNLSVIGFYDYGWVKPNHNNNVASPAVPNGYSLEGFGVTLAWQATQAMDFKATIAQRMGNNPAANTTTGMDSDGTKKITRIWLSSSIAF
jgi:hemolysin activation/secretion protein